MADYWKSQPRKFCDFCKCWIADNKPSRDFHEKGKRHQENVSKRIYELRKKGLEQARNEKDAGQWMVQMEKEAMKKLREDLAADPSLASQYGVTIKKAQSEAPKSEKKKKITAAAATEATCDALPPLPPSDVATKIEPKDVKEAKFEPEEPTTVDSQNCPERSSETDEERTRKRPAHAVYGEWTNAQEPESSVIDLGFSPEENRKDTKTITLSAEPKIKFKEKTVTSLGGTTSSQSAVTFKKRKINSFAAKGNLRRTDDD